MFPMQTKSTLWRSDPTAAPPNGRRTSSESDKINEFEPMTVTARVVDGRNAGRG